MSTTMSWLEVSHPFFKVSVVGKGCEMPDGQRVSEDYAFVFEADEVVVIEGSEAQLRLLLQKMAQRLVTAVDTTAVIASTEAAVQEAVALANSNGEGA